MDIYSTRALDGASPVELVIALYDGMIRFMHSAAEAADRGNVKARRVAVKRALDIIIHLQSRLRMDVGERPAEALSEFYASVFAQILEASHFSSRRRFERAIDCVRNVREAWKRIALESSIALEGRERGTPPGSSIAIHSVPAANGIGVSGLPESARWTA